MRNSQKSTGIRQYNKSELPRLRWTPELHEHFSYVVESLGGKYKATPKRILQMMNVKGLRISHIKSHLQMYRSMKHDNGSSNDVLITMKNLHIQTTHCHLRQIENERLIDWEYQRSNKVTDEVFPEEITSNVNPIAADDEEEYEDESDDEQQDSSPRIVGKSYKEENGDFNEICALSLAFSTTPSHSVGMMIPNEEERDLFADRDRLSDQSNSFVDYNFQDFQSLGTNLNLNLGLTI